MARSPQPSVGPDRENDRATPRLAGFITERDLEMAERELPGIVRFFHACSAEGPAPRSFLELVVRYQGARS